MRRWHRTTLADLGRLRVPLKKIMPFIVTADHKPALVGSTRWQGAMPVLRQPELFAPDPAIFAAQL
jgi:predicted DNA-binding helix-hairpin-helix protein